MLAIAMAVLLVCSRYASGVFVVGVPLGVEIRLVGFAQQIDLQSYFDSLASSTSTALKWIRPRISYKVVDFQTASNFTEAHARVQTSQQVDELFSTIHAQLLPPSTFVVYVSLLEHDLLGTNTCTVGPISLSTKHRFAVIHLTPNKFQLFGDRGGGGVYFDPEHDLPALHSPWFASRLASLCHRTALHLILPSPEPPFPHSHVVVDSMETPMVVLTLMTTAGILNQATKLQWEIEIGMKLRAYKLDRIKFHIVDKCAVCTQAVSSMQRGDWESAQKLLQSATEFETNVFNIAVVVLLRDDGGLTMVHLDASASFVIAAVGQNPTDFLCGKTPIVRDHASTQVLELVMREIFYMRPTRERIDAGNLVVVDYLFAFDQPATKAQQDTAQRNPILLHLDRSLDMLRLVPKPSKNAPAVLLAQLHNARIEAKRAGMLLGMFNHEQAKAYALAFRRSVATVGSTSKALQATVGTGEFDDEANVFPIIMLLLVTGMLALVYEAKVAKFAQGKSNASRKTAATTSFAVPRKDFFTPTQKRE